MSHDKKDKNAKKQTTKDLEQQVSQLAAQVYELTEALQRERADADNIRRHHADELSNLKNVVKAGVVRDLLPIIDNFDRSLRHVPKELQNNDYVKGVQGIVKQFEKTLGDIGVTRIKTVGEVFDPRLHEAISVEDGDPSTSSGQVVEVICEELQSGYALGNEVIRHAMVKVRMESAPEDAKSNKQKEGEAT
ncbi:MAG: nucleotide exchange factor GrpE [Candidatus Saccharibacteria bacterium]|nr:nucleotide exchange factor GrpE [Candidatus Saccharibacteria bacterium]